MYYSTSPEVDAIIRSKLEELVNANANKRYPYRLLNANCRTWSQRQFELIAKELEKHKKGVKSTPPPRTVPQPHSTGTVPFTRGTSRSTSEPTTTTTSTTERKTSAH